MEDLAETALASNLYYDGSFARQAAKILPGEYYVTADDMVLVTVLGSCVSACIRDAETGVGGLNHFMLPDAGHDPSNPLSSSARYGTHAMELLVNQLIKLGARRSNLEAKVFGGGNVLRGMTVTDVGARNAAFVLGYLATEGIRIAARDLVDVFPRKIYFFPHSGRVLVRKLKSLHNRTILEREQEYRGRLSRTKVAGDIDLFV